MKQTKAPYLFDAKHGIALHEIQGNWASFCSEGEVSVFLELRQEPGVYSRVRAGIDTQNSFLFSDVRTPV